MHMWLIAFLFYCLFPGNKPQGSAWGAVKGQENIILREKKKIKESLRFAKIKESLRFTFNWVDMLLADKYELGLVLKHEFLFVKV